MAVLLLHKLPPYNCRCPPADVLCDKYHASLRNETVSSYLCPDGETGHSARPAPGQCLHLQVQQEEHLVPQLRLPLPGLAQPRLHHPSDRERPTGAVQ